MRLMVFDGEACTDMEPSGDTDPKRAFQWFNGATWKVKIQFLPKRVWYYRKEGFWLAKIGFTAPNTSSAPKKFPVYGFFLYHNQTKIRYIGDAQWVREHEFKSWVETEAK